MDARYLAGFFDGEGGVSIGITTVTRGNCRYWVPQLQVTLTNIDLTIMKNIKGFLNYGHLNQLRLRRRTERDCFQIRFHKPEDIIHFVDAILPYSYIKKQLLELVRKAAVFVLSFKGSQKWTPEVLDDFQERYVNKCRELNGHSTRGRKCKYPRPLKKEV